MLVLAWRVALIPGEGSERETASVLAQEENLSYRGSSGMHGGAGRRIVGRVSLQSREEQGTCIHQGMDPQ